MPSSFGMSFLASPTFSSFIIPLIFAAPLQTEPGPGQLLIDVFDDPKINALGQYHGGSGIGQFGDEEQGLTIATDIVDDYFDIELSKGCTDLIPYSQHSLHIVYSGSDKFSISLQQNNAACSEYSEPYPETWDSVEAARYNSASQTDIWVPISHFNINLTRAKAIGLEAFYTVLPTHFYKIELVPDSQVPADVNPPHSMTTGDLVLECKIPNTFAFAIDDGDPELAQEMLQILKEEDIKVTFFAVGKGLADESTNLTNVYKEALSLGHQVGLHSWSHPKMEALPSDEEIDQQFRWNIDTLQMQLGIESTYFRPPYGTVGARTRQSLGRHVPDDPTIVMWTIDVEDWIWGDSPTPEKQLEAFKRGVDRGGNLVVLHYLHASTVEYLKEMIKYVKMTGWEGEERRIVTVEECMSGGGPI